MKHSLNKGTAKESILANFSEQQNLEDTLNNKQNKLVSGINIKTINGESLLGSGDITVENSGASAYVEGDVLVINNSGGTNSGGTSSSGGSSSSGSVGGGVIDVTELPTENIDSNATYALFKVFGVYNQYIQTNPTVYIVDTLPDTGENCAVDGSGFTVMYYNKSDDSVYGYVDATLGSGFGITAGWYPVSALLTVGNVTYDGVVGSFSEIKSNDYYFVKQYDFYIYKGKWIKLDKDYELIHSSKHTLENDTTELDIADNWYASLWLFDSIKCVVSDNYDYMAKGVGTVTIITPAFGFVTIPVSFGHIRLNFNTNAGKIIFQEFTSSGTVDTLHSGRTYTVEIYAK